MGEEGLEALGREESRVEKLLSDGKMSVIKQDELRLVFTKTSIRSKLTSKWVS